MIQYLLSVHPDKEESFFQLLESLQELGVIEAFAPIEQGGIPQPGLEFPGLSREMPEYDLAEQYRDLVD